MWKRRKYTGEEDDELDALDIEDVEEEKPKSSWRRKKAPKAEDDEYDMYNEEDEYAGGNRSRSGRPVLFGVIAAVLAAVILVINLMPKGNKVYNSLCRSGDELLSYLDDSSVLPERIGHMEALKNGGDYSMELSLAMPGLTASLETDYSTSKKKMDGVVALENAGEQWRVAMNFHADKKEMYFEVPGLINDAYGFTLEDFNRRTNGSGDEDIFFVKRLHFFSPTNLRGHLKRTFGSDWDAFEKTLKTEKFEKREVQLGTHTKQCTIYRVSWDPAAAEKLWVNKTGLLEPLVARLMSLVPDLEPDFRVFLDEQGRLVGCDFSTPTGKYTLFLEGQENVWDSFSLEVLYINGTARYLTGKILQEGNQVHLRLDDETGCFFVAAYDNTTGEFCFIREGRVLLEGSLKAVGEGTELEFLLGEGVVLSVALSPLEKMPVGPTRNYLDLLDLSALQKARLWTELINSNVSP